MLRVRELIELLAAEDPEAFVLVSDTETSDQAKQLVKTIERGRCTNPMHGDELALTWDISFAAHGDGATVRAVNLLGYQDEPMHPSGRIVTMPEGMIWQGETDV